MREEVVPVVAAAVGREAHEVELLRARVGDVGREFAEARGEPEAADGDAEPVGRRHRERDGGADRHEQLHEAAAGDGDPLTAEHGEEEMPEFVRAEIDAREDRP